VIIKLIVCPNDLAAAVTVPPTIPITRAGQHQAPISAGIDKSSANREQHIALLDSLGTCSDDDNDDDDGAEVIADVDVDVVSVVCVDV